MDKKVFDSLLRAVTVVLGCIAAVFIIHANAGLFRAEFHEGDIALRSIYAPYDFKIKGPVNTELTGRRIQEAISKVPLVFVFDEDSMDRLLRKIDSIRDSLVSLKASQGAGESRVEEVKDIAVKFNLPETTLSQIYNLKDLDTFFANIKKTLSSEKDMLVVSEDDYRLLKSSATDTVMVLSRSGGPAKMLSKGNFISLGDLKDRVSSNIRAVPFRGGNEKALAAEFLKAVVTTSAFYDKDKTEGMRKKATESVQPVYDRIQIKKNEVILNKGERINKQHIEMLKALMSRESLITSVPSLIAVFILVALFAILLSLYLRSFERPVVAENKNIVLISVVSVLTLLAAKLIVMSPWPSNLIPISVASMLLAILLNGRIAVIVTCFLSILIGLVSGERLDIAGMSMVGGIIGIFAVGGVRRRNQLLAAGLCVGLANLSYLIATGLIARLDFNTYITEALFGFANGIISSVVVAGVLPVFENTFKVITDISLLELADLNHPVLKEMVMKAPGTYHHSLVVGNLAEAACEAIGANPLLARVASYFHDIGKIDKASYFSENQAEDKSAHDRLSPTMSSLIITSHVKNGIEIAQRYRLNKRIIDIINQHHGTGLVFYFFKRALEKGQEGEVGEDSFRYPGPKPQTREAACVLLADSVEAASRSLENPTPSRIKGLVRKIINNKFIDGQLDECELTLKDLEKIAEVFTHILTGMFHTRVGYPEEGKEK